MYNDESQRIINIVESKDNIKWEDKDALAQITYLNLNNQQLTDISVLGELPNLTSLYLSSNQLTDISVLNELPKLTSLYLRNNQLTNISILVKLTNLTDLNLRGNQIKKIPKELFHQNLKLHYESNPLEEPPKEIYSQGQEAIHEYFKSLEEDQQELNELKILFVGDGGAGKTSLIKKILSDTFDKDESMTHGIDIRDKEINLTDKTINAHFWDFGGQEMMHSTHQFFLSNRALYVLVLDGRKEEDSEYWLNFIQSFGGTSPILIVLNKMDDNEGFEINRKFLKEKYPNIYGFYKVSCSDGRGVNDFYEGLKLSMLEIEVLSTTWGKSWFSVKKTIEELKENFINRERFIEICNSNNINENSAQDILSKYLDDLGVAIHFDDFTLNEIHTLKPQWITNGVYRLVTSKVLSDNKGVLDISTISTLLPTDEYPLYTHKYIIELMKKFELCYQINENSILVPALLEIEEKKFEFDYEDTLSFELQYSFLPLSTIDKFIVKSHSDIKEGLRWRSGVVLEDKSTKSLAVIKVDNREKKVKIYVSGDERRDFFSVIRKRFFDINSKYPEITIHELIPLPNYPSFKVKYKELLGYEKASKDDYFNGEIGETFSVSKLLNGIERRENSQSNTTNNYYEEKIMGNKNIDKSITAGRDANGSSSGNKNMITASITTSNSDLEEILEAFQAEANKVLGNLSEDKKDDFKEDVDTFIEKVQENKFDKYFKISKVGLLEAAEAVGEVGIKLSGYIPKILKGLSGYE